ncbi:MAG TPA: hypothetical protein VFV23_07385 [Verrucomicrobiae bacterium]|nr:hypothetical protein [Verrucomicrobiae bacterium]
MKVAYFYSTLSLTVAAFFLFIQHKSLTGNIEYLKESDSSIIDYKEKFLKYHTNEETERVLVNEFVKTSLDADTSEIKAINEFRQASELLIIAIFLINIFCILHQWKHKWVPKRQEGR